MKSEDLTTENLTETFEERPPELIGTIQMDGYEIRTYKHDGRPFGMKEDFETVSCFTPEGWYVGDPEFTAGIYKLGIKPELISPERNVCQIGFCEANQCWVGWSHRAISSFYIGLEVKKGDCAYKAANEEDFKEECLEFWKDNKYHASTWAEIGTSKTDEGETTLVRGVWVKWKYNDEVPNPKCRGQIGGTFTPFPETWGKGEWKAETLEDAKQMAIDFAEDVG